jgi:hypothetical protein
LRVVVRIQGPDRLDFHQHGIFHQKVGSPRLTLAVTAAVEAETGGVLNFRVSRVGFSPVSYFRVSVQGFTPNANTAWCAFKGTTILLFRVRP